MTWIGREGKCGEMTGGLEIRTVEEGSAEGVSGGHCEGWVLELRSTGDSFGPDLVMRVRMMGCCGRKRREEMRIIKGNGEMCA